MTVSSIASPASASSTATVVAALLGAALGAILTIFGQPYFTSVLDHAKSPLLVSEVSSTNIDGLSEELRRQITVVTTRFSLKHRSGGTAKNVTIEISPSVEILRTSVVVAQSSEPFEFKSSAAKSFTIDIAAMRPNSSIVVEVTHAPSIKVEWTTLVAEGSAIDAIELERRSKSGLGSRPEALWFVGFMLATLVGLSLVAKYIARAIPSATSDEQSQFSEASHRRLVWLLSFCLLWNWVIRSSGMDLLHFPIAEILYALIIYLIVTNLSGIRNALSQKSRE